MEEKLSLLKDLIIVANADGHFREEEQQFIYAIAEQMGITPKEYIRLFKENIEHAPPLLEMIIIGIFSSIALSIARAIFSPTTEPIEPPIKAKSMTAIDTFKPLIFPTAVLTASVKPLLDFEGRE